MKFIKIHYQYLFSKANYVLLAILSLGSITLGFICKNAFCEREYYFYQTELLESIIENIVLYCKTIVFVLLAFIWGNSFTKEKNKYHLLIDDYNTQKYHFFITKYLLLSLETFIICSFIFIVILIFKQIFAPWFLKEKELLIVFINLFLLLEIYGTLAGIFTTLYSTVYASFSVLALFYISEFLSNDKKIFSIIYSLCFPVLELDKDNYSMNRLKHFFILLITYQVILFILYCFKNVRNKCTLKNEKFAHE